MQIIITFSLLYFPKNLSKSFSQVKGTLSFLPQTFGILKSEEIKNKNGRYADPNRIRLSQRRKNVNFFFEVVPIMFGCSPTIGSEEEERERGRENWINMDEDDPTDN